MNTTKLLLTSCIILFYGCRESDKDSPVKQPAQDTNNTTYYEAIFSIDSVHAQNQYYQFKNTTDSLEIAEQGIFLSDSTIIAKARLQFFNNEYEEVEINFNNGQISSDVIVKRQREGVYYSYRNSSLVDSIVKTNEAVLFDGPNPSFDYVNCQYLLSNADSAENEVVLINWITGSLSTEKMQFKKTDEGFDINKTDTKRKNSIELNELPFAIQSSVQNKEKHIFSPLENDPGYFD